MVGIAIFELGSILCGAATSANMFVVGRAIGGAGAAGLFNGVMTIIAEIAPVAERPSALRSFVHRAPTDLRQNISE